MPMTPPRQYFALAIDGGGVKGLIVAQALIKLEEQLGEGNPKRLINNTRLKVMTGTSTGAIIAAGLAVGMSAAEIAQLYIDLSTKLFTPIAPTWLPEGLKRILTGLIGLTRPSLYPQTGLEKILRDNIDKHTAPIQDITLGQLGERLTSNQQSLVITTSEIASRHTHFLKTYSANDKAWPLWEATYASSAAPTIFPVDRHDGNPPSYYTDGGVGSYGNPAFIAAREIIDWNGYDPKDVTLYSFGTGWVSPTNYIKANGEPSNWNILDWAENATTVFIQDAARAQSNEIIDRFVNLNDQTQGMDFRRFQPALQEDFNPFAPVEETIAKMTQIGNVQGQRILDNNHPLAYLTEHPDTPPANYPEETDPEGLILALQTYRKSKALGGAAKQ